MRARTGLFQPKAMTAGLQSKTGTGSCGAMNGGRGPRQEAQFEAHNAAGRAPRMNDGVVRPGVMGGMRSPKKAGGGNERNPATGHARAARRRRFGRGRRGAAQGSTQVGTGTQAEVGVCQRCIAGAALQRMGDGATTGNTAPAADQRPHVQTREGMCQCHAAAPGEVIACVLLSIGGLRLCVRACALIRMYLGTKRCGSERVFATGPRRSSRTALDIAAAHNAEDWGSARSRA